MNEPLRQFLPFPLFLVVNPIPEENLASLVQATPPPKKAIDPSSSEANPHKLYTFHHHPLPL